MTEPVAPIRAVGIEYEPPRPPVGSRVMAAVGMTVAGLVIVGFGGCFLIGVMIQLNPQMVFGPAITTPWTPADWFFHAVLYLMSFACFAKGSWLVFRGTGALGRVIGEKP